MPISPGANESQSEWMHRCVPEMMSGGDGGRSQDQAVAICMDIWRSKSPRINASANHWRKTHVSQGNGLEFILSDETVDRMDDVIAADGWDVTNFKENPVALFAHNQELPIGKWKNIRVENKALRAELELAEAGTSPRIDEMRSLIAQGILRATSVGFRAHERKPREDSKNGGIHFLKQELLEASIVAVPANPAALAIAKSLNLSRDTIDLVFGKSAASGEVIRRVPSGEPAAKANANQRTGIMSAISERIENAQTSYVAAKAELEKHLAGLDDTNVSDAQLNKTQELNGIVKSRANLLSTLRDAESNLGSTAQAPAMYQAHSGVVISNPRPFAVPAKKIEPKDYIFRSFAVLVKHHGVRQSQSLVETLRQGYGEDEVTRGFLEQVTTKAATVPADTVTSGWASQLVQTAIGEYFDPLLPLAVYPGLSARGGRFTFGRNGTISLPTRSTTPTVAGSFFAQGAPIPVRQAAFSAISLTPKKMGVITTMTREIMEHSIPAIEQLLRNAMQEDTVNAIDNILLDANAATTVRPAGILNGATTAAGTAGGGIAAVVADVKGMLGSLITATAGNLRLPTWIMNPVQAVALQLTQNAGGDFPFETEVNQSRFRGYPLLQSTLVTAGTVILLDAADFFSATGDEPRFDVSDQAVLHMEDTSPAQIGTVGSPNVVAAPARSLWQTDSIGIRLILDINWAFRRTGMVISRTAVTW